MTPVMWGLPEVNDISEGGRLVFALLGDDLIGRAFGVCTVGCWSHRECFPWGFPTLLCSWLWRFCDEFPGRDSPSIHARIDICRFSYIVLLSFIRPCQNMEIYWHIIINPANVTFYENPFSCYLRTDWRKDRHSSRIVAASSCETI
jgi:hypothetical protein